MTEDQLRRRAYDDTPIREIKGVNEDFILHIPAGRPLREAVDFLAQHRIGLTLVIASDGGLAGVISERDVIRALYEHGNDALVIAVDKFMTRDVITCTDDDRAIDVARLMSEHHIRHMPIIEGSYLAGMVSATDMVRHFASKA
jgi:CBS domain-containing protein